MSSFCVPVGVASQGDFVILYVVAGNHCGGLHTFAFAIGGDPRGIAASCVSSLREVSAPMGHIAISVSAQAGSMWLCTRSDS